MSTKYKPNKGMKKRFRVSATGKVKHNHSFTSHLRSARSAKRKRHLRNASVLSEGHAKNMRAYMGLKALRPNKIAAERKLAEKTAAAVAAK
jgi:large subunit ribosomal protein L35